MNSTNKRHHAGYVSNQDIIHKCLETYYDMFSNMPFQWYVQNVYDSASRKGFNIPQDEVEATVRYFLQWKRREVCHHCKGRWQ